MRRGDDLTLHVAAVPIGVVRYAGLDEGFNLALERVLNDAMVEHADEPSVVFEDTCSFAQREEMIDDTEGRSVSADGKAARRLARLLHETVCPTHVAAKTGPLHAVRAHGGTGFQRKYVPAALRQLDRQMAGAGSEVERANLLRGACDLDDLVDGHIGVVGTPEIGVREQRVVPVEFAGDRHGLTVV